MSEEVWCQARTRPGTPGCDSLCENLSRDGQAGIGFRAAQSLFGQDLCDVRGHSRRPLAFGRAPGQALNGAMAADGCAFGALPRHAARQPAAAGLAQGRELWYPSAADAGVVWEGRGGGGAYCLKPNHVQLIAVLETESGPARADGEARLRHTRGVNFRETRRGYLCQGLRRVRSSGPGPGRF
jgi:hypothetical protein